MNVRDFSITIKVCVVKTGTIKETDVTEGKSRGTL